MYIYPYRNHRRRSRLPFVLGCLAFTCTLAIILIAVWVRAPDELIAALNVVSNVTPTPTVTSTPTVTPRATRRPGRTPTAPATIEPTGTPITVVEHFIMGRPVLPTAKGIIPDWTYLYGNTQRGEQAVHHGEEFVNPRGTTLVAVNDGVVVVAGTDHEPSCGENHDQWCAAHADTYGNLVVIQLDESYKGQKLFALYGHMDTIAVKVGDRVRAGDAIGTVGESGEALGPHVHFELRLGANDYFHTRNPILWMKPLPGYGVIAGRVQDRNGNLIRGQFVFLYNDQGNNDYLLDTETYQRDDKPPVNSDDEMGENFALGDLRAGNYLLAVKIGGLNYQKHITIQEGKLTFVVFGGE